MITEDVSTSIENYNCLLDVPKENGKKKNALFTNHSFLTVLDLGHSDVTVPYRATGHYCFFVHL